MRPTDHDDDHDGRSDHHHYDDDGGPAIHYPLDNLDDFTADNLVAAIFDVSPCHDDDCRDDRPALYFRPHDQRSRDVAVIRATIRAANVYDGRPRRVPVTVDDILADADRNSP